MIEHISTVGNIKISNRLPMILIAGPCMLESRDVVFRCAEHLVKMAEDLKIPFIFKTSFDKANRTSINSKRGIPLEDGLKIFSELKNTFQCPILTDVHETWQVDVLSPFIDVFQIPAFLCRQTDLIVAAAKTDKMINLKKGQFLAPWDMKNVCEKAASTGNENITICERGVCFGYNTLVSDMRSLKIMSEFGYPIIFDATHSVQSPGGLGNASGGQREYVEVLARAAASIGIAGIFVETHFDPAHALSDGPNMVPLHVMKNFIATIQRFDELGKSMPYQNMDC